MISKRRHTAVLAALLSATAVPVLAQQQPDGGPAAGTADQPATAQSGDIFGDIVVTARKREESLQDVPLAINAFGEEFIDKFRIQNVQDISTFTPGLLAVEANTVGGNHIYLRGIGSQLDSALADGAVSIVVDGVQVPGHIMRAAGFDLGRIEVLRGPQALFFGKNSPGGIISMTSATPTKDLSLNAIAGYEFAAREIYGEAVIAGPIGDTLSGRAGVRYSTKQGEWKIRSVTSNSDPFFPSLATPDDRGSDQHDLTLRGSLAFKPSDAFDATLNFTYFDLFSDNQIITQRLNCNGPNGRSLESHPEFNALEDCKLNNTVVMGQNFPGVLAADPKYSRNEPMGFVSNKTYFAAGTINYHLSDQLTATSVSGYFRSTEATASNFSNIPAPIIYSDQNNRLTQVSEELRLASDFGGVFDFLAGGYYEHSRTAYRQAIITSIGNTVTGYGGPGTPLIDTARQKREAKSLFAQATIRPAERLNVDIGGRYSWESKDVTYRSNLFPTPIPGLLLDNTPTIGRNYKNFSPEITARYEPTPEANIYASYKRAFKSGGITASAGQPTSYIVSTFVGSPGVLDVDYEQEKAKGFEGGVKLTLLDRRLRLNFAAFTYKYTGLQLSSFDPNSAQIKIQNIGGAKSRGLEMDFNYRTGLAGFTIYGNAAYLHARYSRFIGDCYGGQSQAEGCIINPRRNASGGIILDPNGNPIYQSQDQAGQRLKSAPDFTATLGFNYDTTLTSNLKLGLAVDSQYSSKYSPDLANNPEQYQGSFAKLNATVRISTADDRWMFSVIGKNLTDKYIVAEASKDFQFGSTGTGTVAGGRTEYFGNVIRGREVRAQIGYKF